jgi:hypothetical protein
MLLNGQDISQLVWDPPLGPQTYLQKGLRRFTQKVLKFVSFHFNIEKSNGFMYLF